jgi:hypothetical protein
LQGPAEIPRRSLVVATPVRGLTLEVRLERIERARERRLAAAGPRGGGPAQEDAGREPVNERRQAVGRTLDAHLRPGGAARDLDQRCVQHHPTGRPDDPAQQELARAQARGQADGGRLVQVLGLGAHGAPPGAGHCARVGRARAALAGELGREKVNHALAQVVQ